MTTLAGPKPSKTIRRKPDLTPYFLEDALKFKTDAATFHGRWVIETLRRYEGEDFNLLKPLYDVVDKTRPDSRFGRKRAPGRYELAYFAFVFSRHPDVRPWWQTAGHSIWTAAGFKERPSYALVHRRFTELENPAIIGAVEAVAAQLIQLAVKGSDGHVGRYLHVDSTEAETHARLRHVCPRGSTCWGEETPGADWRGGPMISASAPTPFVRAKRHIETAGPEPEDFDGETEIGDAEKIEREPGRLRVKVGRCWYEILDETAGVRAYINPSSNPKSKQSKNGKRPKQPVKRFWVGYYNGKAIDHFTGAPVAVQITSASINESVSYPGLFAAAVKNTGRVPVAVAGDKGYSVASVFEHNTRRGVGSVFPWRKQKMRDERWKEDCEEHDRYGVVRCKYCGAPTKLVSFARTAGEKRETGNKRGPRLYVKCALPVKPECQKRQSMGCDFNWRMLLPIWRDNPIYLVLRNSHDRYERVHHHWRVRWRSGADDHSLRPKRRGKDVQQLRANAALLVEWLMICWREDWLPDCRPLGKPDPSRMRREDGDGYEEEMRELRAELLLDQPYGANAVVGKKRIGPERPLKERPSRKDPSEPEEKEITLAGLVEEDAREQIEEMQEGDVAEVSDEGLAD